MFKVIVAGGRDFVDSLYLHRTLDKLLSNKAKDQVVIISGRARGADTLGENYGVSKGIRVDGYLANWDKYGKSAGYRRNVEMANDADALVAFWDGKSRGTMHMINIANEKGLQVRVKPY